LAAVAGILGNKKRASQVELGAYCIVFARSHTMVSILDVIFAVHEIGILDKDKEKILFKENDKMKQDAFSQ
jgi:hypothetical protein